MSITSYRVIDAGGFPVGTGPTMQDHYAWVRQGAAPRDVVAINGPINRNVRPQNCNMQVMPLGRCFSMSNDGSFVPGVVDDHEIPVACILIGSHANSGDVTGVYRGGDPQYDKNAFVPIKDEANAPFYCLGAGYIYETSEYDQAAVTQLVPLAPLTAHYSLTDFDIAGKFTPGHVYRDHIVGILLTPPAPLGINQAIDSITFQGKVVPKLPADWITALDNAASEEPE
jgi:hypothetical protein